MSKRNKVNYIQNDEPSFIRQFKEKIGYKEEPDVNTKRQRLEYHDEEEDRSDTEEEKPTVVVLKTGDLTAEEADEVDDIQKKLEEEEAIRDGKIKFKRPVKKGETESTEKADGASSTTEKSDGATSTEKDKKKGKKKKQKETKKSSLLSFGDEEEEEEG